MGFRRYCVITTSSEKYNYPSKEQKLEESNTQFITRTTCSSLILFLCLFSSYLFCCSHSSIFFTYLAPCNGLTCFQLLFSLCFSSLEGDIRFYELSQDHFLHGQSGMRTYMWPAERSAKLIFLQTIRNHSSAGKQLNSILANLWPASALGNICKVSPTLI